MIKEYAKEIARLKDWNHTTTVRTHYKLKPHIADTKVKNIVDSKIANNIFYSVEEDRDDSDIYTKVHKVNHLHLLLDLPIMLDKTNTRKRIAKSMSLNIGTIGEVQPIEGVAKTTRYILKKMGTANSHHNFFNNQ